MSNIITFFKNIYFFDYNRQSVIGSNQRQVNSKALILFLFLFVFLLVLRPAFMSYLSYHATVGISFCTSSIFVLLGWLYYSYLYKNVIESEWTLKKDIVSFYCFLLLASSFFCAYIFIAINYIYKAELQANNWRLENSFPFWLLATIVFVGTLVFLLLRFIDYSKLINEYLVLDFKQEEKSERAFEEVLLKEGIRLNRESTVLELCGKNKDEKIEIKSNRFLYLEAFGHYVKVYFKDENNELKVKIIRNSVNNIMDSLDNKQELFQCHRSFIVNVNKIQSIEGNSKKAFLKIKECGATVPLSRVLYGELKKTKRFSEPISHSCIQMVKE